jgi:hypothetical protein
MMLWSDEKVGVVEKVRKRKKRKKKKREKEVEKRSGKKKKKLDICSISYNVATKFEMLTPSEDHGLGSGFIGEYWLTKTGSD